MTVGLARQLVAGVPLVLLAVAMGVRWPTARFAGASLLSFAWTLGSLPVVSVLAARVGWWRFGADGDLGLEAPFDVLFGWMVWWGPVTLLAAPRAPLPVVVATLWFVDLILMPQLAPLLALDGSWHVGEVVALAVVLVPAQLLGRWTTFDQRLEARVALLLAAFVLVVLGLLPHAVLTLTGGDWSRWPAPNTWAGSGACHLLALAGLGGLAAVLEFARVGQGTPLPFDPPRQLVTSGPYAYVANPMQVSTALVFLVMAFVAEEPALAGIAVMAVVFGSGFAAWSEGADLTARFGPAHEEWRRSVRRWLPRWRPAGPTGATLWIARSCGPCSSVGAWVERRSPVGLRVAAAEDHPTKALRRMAYEAPGQPEEEGVAALARALEHLNLAWATVGFAIRVPGVTQAATLLVDAVGGGPRDLERR